MSNKAGDTILSLDATFKLNFLEGNDGTTLDADGGILGSVWLGV